MPGTTRTSLIRDLQRMVDGEVTDAPEVLERYSQDFGGMVRRTPAAVVRPRGAEDVARAVQYAYAHGIPVSSRGMAHSLRGQALSEQGILIDMRALRRLDDIAVDAQEFLAEPGTLWREVVAASTRHGLAPPVLTGYPHASLGGTLSACGWGFASGRYGGQIDNCLELEVVTGTGERVLCSREENSELFHHVLGGMGQFGLMTRVRHRLRRYGHTVRTYVLEYEELTAYLEDNRTLATGEVADYLECTLHRIPEDKGARWSYRIRASVETGAPERLDGQRLLSGLRFSRHVATEELPTAVFLAQPEVEESPRPPGRAHPWMVTFMPWSRLQPFLEMCLQRMPAVALGGNHGQLRLWPAPRNVTRMPMLRVPQEDMMALLGFFPTATEAALPALMALMSRLSDAGMEAGARRHLGTWVHFDRPRWRMHFGDYWPTVNRLKRTYDPKGILNPGFIDFEPEVLLSP